MDPVLYKMVAEDPVVSRHTTVECIVSAPKIENAIIEPTKLKEVSNFGINKSAVCMVKESKVADTTSKDVLKASQETALTRQPLRIQVMNIEEVKKRCIEIDYPLIEEYEFNNDRRNHWI